MNNSYTSLLEDTGAWELGISQGAIDRFRQVRQCHSKSI